MHKSIRNYKKINRNLKFITTYINLINNDKLLKSQAVLENQNHEIIKADIFIVESIIKLPSIKSMRNSMKIELQHLGTKQHFGNWAMRLVEYKISKLFLSLN